MNAEQTETSDREQRLTAVLLDYVEALERRETPNRYELLAANPDLAADLLEFFKSRDQIDDLAAPLREAVQNVAEFGTLGDFRLLREIGRGGMGVVYEAEQLSLKRRVALKVLPFAAAMDPRQLQRFRTEAQAAAHLHHPNIVPVFAVGSERGVHYYAMQFIEGQSLAALLDDLRRAAGLEALTERAAMLERAAKPTQPVHVPRRATSVVTTQAVAALSTERAAGRRYFQRVAVLIRQAAEALEHAHEMGVIHRDIKPGNLLLDQRGELWITDFGLAQFRSDAGLTLTGELVGTLRYASPEQSLAKRGLVDHRTDIYSLGVTLYELLTLTPVFAGRDRQELLHQIAFEEPRPPRTLDAAIPIELETIVLKASAKHPTERYASAREFADDLQRFLDDKPILAQRPSLLDRATKWARRHRSLVASAVVLLLVAVIALTVSNVLIARANREAAASYERERLKAKEASEQRQLADQRFKEARRVVERFLQISEAELGGQPFQGARRKFLEAALVYFQQFLEDAAGDPSIEGELTASSDRVKGILTELSILEGTGQYQLLAEHDVQDDLRPSEEQRQQLREFVARMDQQWHDLRHLRPSEWQQRRVEAARANEAAINAILSPEQRRRLKQIALQQQGPRAFFDSEVAGALKLTPEQQTRIRAIDEEEGNAFMQKMDNRPERDHEEMHQCMSLSFAQTVRRIEDEVLTLPQREQWKALVGKPYEGSLPRLPQKGPPPKGGPLGPFPPRPFGKP